MIRQDRCTSRYGIRLEAVANAFKGLYHAFRDTCDAVRQDLSNHVLEWITLRILRQLVGVFRAATT